MWLALFTPRSSVFGLIQVFHSSLTVPLSHHQYNEMYYQVQIGIYYLSSLPPSDICVVVGDNFSSTLAFHTNIDCVCTNLMIEIVDGGRGWLSIIGEMPVAGGGELNVLR